MLTESNYSLRQLQSDKTSIVDSKSFKQSKSISVKSSKKSADSETISVKSSKTAKSSKKSDKVSKASKDSKASKASKASKVSKNMSTKGLSDKSSKASKSMKGNTIVPPFDGKSAKQGTGFHAKAAKDASVFPIAKAKHTSSLSKLNHNVDGVKELDPLTKEGSKPSLISSTPVQLGLAVAILVISLVIHFIRMKRSKTKHSNAAGGAYKPISTGGEAEMTEMGSDDLDAEYGMDDDDDDNALGMPAQ